MLSTKSITRIPLGALALLVIVALLPVLKLPSAGRFAPLEAPVLDLGGSQVRDDVIARVTTLPAPQGDILEPPRLLSLEKWPQRAPQFSPDGRWYSAYGADKALGIYNAEAPDHPILSLSQGTGVSWAPDSKHFAVVVWTGADFSLKVATLDGLTREVVRTAERWPIQFLQSGELVYYDGGAIVFYDPAETREIRRFDIELESAALHNSYPFEVSPDGATVATFEKGHWAGQRVLRVLDLGSGANTIVSDELLDWGGAPYQWSSDGRSLVFSTYGEDWIPSVAIYDRSTLQSKVIVRGAERGVFGGMTLFSETGVMLFAYWPPGTEPERGGKYMAYNIYSGEVSHLFTGGIGLSASSDGTRIRFGRYYADTEDRGSWVATLKY